MSIERSTIEIALITTHMRSQGSGWGAGPSVLIPSRVNLLPWHGQAMVSVSGFHAVRHPRWVHTALSARSTLAGCG